MLNVKYTYIFVGIAVEPCLGMIYWTNWNAQEASIQRAYDSGYNIESIITTDIRMPNSITLDYEEHKLYWADARLDKIERADYDGSHRVILVHSTPKHPFDMAVYGNLLFWTDWVLRAVLRSNKYSGTDVIWLRKDIGRPMGIAAIQNTTRNCSGSPCKILNGGCEDVCTVINNKVKCECTRGILSNDNNTCVSPTKGTCLSSEFECSSNECIPIHLTCDHINHCNDGSDENLRYCLARLCPSEYFLCKDHRCIPKNQTCDGVRHCSDGSDEIDCDCKSNQFKCNSGFCIPMSHRCDGDPDCNDSSDEMNCNGTFCAQKYLEQCEFTSACIADSWRCDGENDCWDNSDEMNCSNIDANSKIPKFCKLHDEFMCKNGECISLQSRCDGIPDCSQSEDEADCPKRSCKETQFACKNDKECMPLTWLCDGYVDCTDGSDEGKHCVHNKCIDEQHLRCSTGRCIPLVWVCDGEKDCIVHGEDELNCDATNNTDITCPDTMFTCKNRQCIDFQYFCDGNDDCYDNSDEYAGCVPSPFLIPKCEEQEFQCVNEKCIAKEKTCNFVDDCGDNSDEDLTLCHDSENCSAPLFFKCGKFLLLLLF